MWKIAVATLAGFGAGVLLIGTASVLAMGFMIDYYQDRQKLNGA